MQTLHLSNIFISDAFQFQIAHHHHHVPVPVPVPAYYNHPHHHHPEEPEFDGHDYAHPHIQYRKDVEELKEWGIEPYEEPYHEHLEPVNPATMPARAPGLPPTSFTGPTYPGAYGVHQYAPNVQPVSSLYPEKRPTVSAHNLAYSAYADNNRRIVVQPPSPVVPNVSLNPANLRATLLPAAANVKTSYGVFGEQNTRQILTKVNQPEQKANVPAKRQSLDDEYYGPIINRLEDTFKQLRFVEETCKERLVCSMYKNPSVYSPHSNLVSIELSR